MENAVPLRKIIQNGQTSQRQSIWPVQAVQDAPVDLESAEIEKCDLDKAVLLNERHGVCCKTLKGENDRNLIPKELASDLIIGLADGLCVPFALTAGLSSLGNSRLVVTAGLAELIAGAISMGIGGFLATQSEQQHFLHVARQTQERVQRSCSSQMEREVVDILSPFGLDEKTCRTVANKLRQLEPATTAAPPPRDNEGSLLRRFARFPMTSSRSRAPIGESGLTPFLLKHGEGIENTTYRRAFFSAITVGTGYFVGGIVPLLPYFGIANATRALYWSILITGIVLLVFGAVKTRFTTGKTGILSLVYGAITMLAIGAAAAASAFGLVKALEHGNTATVS